MIDEIESKSQYALFPFQLQTKLYDMKVAFHFSMRVDDLKSSWKSFQ